jgi:hypothetical protein
MPTIQLLLSRSKRKKEEYIVHVNNSDNNWRESHTFSCVDVDELLKLGDDPKKYWETPCRNIFKLLFKSDTRSDDALSKAGKSANVLLHIKDEKLMRIPWEFACRDNIGDSMLVLTNHVVRVADESFLETKKQKYNVSCLFV